jgi:hypothetical protein
MGKRRNAFEIKKVFCAGLWQTGFVALFYF